MHSNGAMLLLLTTQTVLTAAPPAVRIEVRRSANNPLITTGTPEAGSNVCGPSVVRVPDWVEKPLGRYYMYFARHMSSTMAGAYIRLAYAESPEGPWTVYKPGTLKRSQLKDLATAKVIHKKQHIASPDVHVDHENKRFIMYFHGRYRGHNTGAAVSKDGINFEDVDVDLGPPYLRVFRHGGRHYGVSNGGTDGASLLRRFDGPFATQWEARDIFPADGDRRVRHMAVLKQDKYLLVFYSCIGDTPERIFASAMELTGDWQTWTPSEPVEVIKPEFPYEGSELPLEQSKAGTGRNRHELRDPCVFVDDDGKTYLYYTIKGECGIAVAELAIEGA